MARKKKAKEIYKLKDVLKFLELKDEDTVFVAEYGPGNGDQIFLVKDVPAKLLKMKAKVIQPKHGGQEYNYDCYRIIVEK